MLSKASDKLKQRACVHRGFGSNPGAAPGAGGGEGAGEGKEKLGRGRGRGSGAGGEGEGAGEGGRGAGRAGSGREVAAALCSLLGRTTPDLRGCPRRCPFGISPAGGAAGP